MGKRKYEEVEQENEMDIVIWPTDEEVLAQIEDEIEPEECICIDEEITNIREQLEEIKDMLKQLLKKKK